MHGPHQGVGHQAHAFHGDALGHGVKTGGAVGFQAVRKRIHAGAGGDFGRHADAQGRVADDHARHHFRVEDDAFGVGALVDDHRRTAHLGAGTRRGRHRDDRGDAAFVGAGPVVADVFEIPDRSGLAAHEGDELAHVQAAAAAEGDHAIVFAGAPGVEPARQVGFDRIGLEVAKQRDAKAGGAQGVQRCGGDRGARQATVGDQQRSLDTLAAAGLGEFGDAADTEADARGVVPVRGQAHGSESRGANGRISRGSGVHSPGATA